MLFNTNLTNCLAGTVIILLIYYVMQMVAMKILEILRLLKIAPLCEGIPYHWLLGHGTLVVNLEHFLMKVKKCTKKSSPPRIFRLGHQVFFMITRKEDLEIVFNHPPCLYKHKSIDFTIAHQGHGLFNLSGPVWKKHKKLIGPTFNKKHLDNYVQIFYEKSEKCAEILKGTKGSIDIYDYISKYSLDSICETAMGYNLQSLTKESKLATAIQTGMEISMLRICNVFYHSDIIFKLSKHSKVFNEAVKCYHDSINKMIEIKKAKFTNNNNHQTVDNPNETQHKPFLDALIELTIDDKDWSDHELLGEVGNFITAGSDIVANAAAFVVLMLAMHPEIEKKCFEEIESVVGMNVVTHEYFPKLLYLERVIKETLRLFSPAPIIIRRLNREVEIGGYKLPKDAGLMIPLASIHMSEEFYKDPHVFDPDRFTAEEMEKRPKYTYMPFSNGPRSCIGVNYAMMSMKTILSVLIRNFKFETTFKDIKEIRVHQTIVLKSVTGYPITVKHRKLCT